MEKTSESITQQPQEGQDRPAGTYKIQHRAHRHGDQHENPQLAMAWFHPQREQAQHGDQPEDEVQKLAEKPETQAQAQRLYHIIEQPQPRSQQDGDGDLGHLPSYRVLHGRPYLNSRVQRLPLLTLGSV